MAGRTRTHNPIHVERSTDRVELCACAPHGLPIARVRKQQEDCASVMEENGIPCPLGDAAFHAVRYGVPRFCCSRDLVVVESRIKLSFRSLRL